MQIALVGASHKLAPVGVRERLALPDLPEEAQIALGERAAEAVVLSTCNRTEIYAVVDEQQDGVAVLSGLLGDLAHVDPETVSPYLYHARGREAVRHLYSVAAGLDSMVVGESQIIGQVSSAYRSAVEGSLTGPVLNWVFPHALKVGKRARAETGIGRSAVSVSTAAVELARRHLGTLSGKVVLVVGAGKVGELTMQALLGAGADRILVANRTYSRAAALASRAKAPRVEVAATDDVSAEGIAEADLVVSSTGAPSPIITARMVREAMCLRPGRPLLVVDLAVPRDVDPEVGRLDGVTLFDIDALRVVREANHERRRREATAAREIVAEELREFDAWWEALRVVPTIVALRSRAEAVRQAEVARAIRKLGDVSDDERAVIEALTSSIVNKLLHQPTLRLKDTSASPPTDYDAAVRELFGLAPERVRSGAG